MDVQESNNSIGMNSDERKRASRKRSHDKLTQINEKHHRTSFPTRDCSSLYASPITIQCAQIHKCIPCSYKIGLFDVSLDTEFTKSVPNARPEQCPRSSVKTMPSGTMNFQEGMAVLTIGDGDVSFSLALARILKPYACKSTVIATSYESQETLQVTYPRFRDYSRELASLGARLYFNVDATRLAHTLPNVGGLKFDRICWNFPCTAIADGQDGQNDAMEKNKDLVRQFVKDAKKLLSNCGEIHICHKSKPPYNQWGLERVALEWLPSNSMIFDGRIILDRFLLPPYRPLKALDSKSFPCHDACFYIFRSAEGSDAEAFSRTIGDEEEGRPKMPTKPITEAIILSIRRNLLKDASSKKRKEKAKRQRKFRG